MKSFLTLVVFLITENGSEEEKKFVHTLRAFQRRAVKKYNFTAQIQEGLFYLPLLEVKTHGETELGVLKSNLATWAQKASSMEVLLNRSLIEHYHTTSKLILQTVTGNNPFYAAFAPQYYELFEDQDRDAREPRVFGVTVLSRVAGEPVVSIEAAQKDFDSMEISMKLKIKKISILTSPISRNPAWTEYATVPLKGGN